MPYIIIEQDGQHCIRLLNPDGVAGELVAGGCHATTEDAEAHIAALLAGEDGAAKSDVLVTFGSAIKALETPGRVGGYLVYWGSAEQADLQGEYFTRDTDLCLDWYPQRPALYHHGLDSTLKASAIGVIDTLKMDDTGLWAEAQLDMRHKYIAEIQRLIDQGVLHWSSGSLPHIVKRVKGWIEKWPIVEGSFTPAPADWRQTTQILALKSLPASALTLTPPEESHGAAKEADALPTHASSPESDQPSSNGATKMDVRQMALSILNTMLQARPDVQMTDEEKNALVEQAVSGMGMEAAAAVPVDQMETVSAKAANAVKTHLLAHIQQRTEYTNAAQKAIAAAAQQAMRDTPPSRHPANFTGQMGMAGKGVMGDGSNAPRISNQVNMAYYDLTAEDMIFGHEVLRAAGKSLSSDYQREVFGRMIDDAQAGRGVVGKNPTLKSRLSAIKADEIMYSTQAGAGDEFVSQAWSDQLWESVRAAVIYREFMARGMMEVTIPQGAETVYVPTEGSDPTWYSLPEAKNDNSTTGYPDQVLKSSKSGTGRVALTAGYIGAQVSFSDVLEENSIIRMLPFHRRQMQISAEEQIESLLLNGDTATGANTNLNLIDGTPSVDGSGRGPAYLALNGILKYAIITATAYSRDAGASFDETDFLETLKLFPKKLRQDRRKLLFVIDSDTHIAALNIPALKTMDSFNPATLVAGQLRNIFAVDVLESAFIEKANTAGKISSTGGNNTKGRISGVRPDQWALGRKRNVTTESDRDIKAQATIVVSTLGIALANRGDGAAVASYNVAI